MDFREAPFIAAAGRVPGSKMTDPNALATTLVGSAEPAGGRPLLSLPTPMPLLLLVLLLSCMLNDGWAEGCLRKRATLEAQHGTGCWTSTASKMSSLPIQDDHINGAQANQLNHCSSAATSVDWMCVHDAVITLALSLTLTR